MFLSLCDYVLTVVRFSLSTGTSTSMALQNPYVTNPHPFQIHLTGKKDLLESQEPCGGEECYLQAAVCRTLQHIE